jgi:plasmid stabilization system protein ParE
MPESRTAVLIWTPAARADLIRLRSFIEPHNPQAARRAAESIKEAAKLLMANPAIGKRVEERQDRELFIPFGQRGYVLRYRVDDKTVVVLHVWHGLENRNEQQ